MTITTADSTKKSFFILHLIKLLFVRVGVLPFFLMAALFIFSIASANFLTGHNLINVARQSVYLVLVSLGQMIVLLTGGFDLAVGMTIAMTSVLTALAMVSFANVFPDAVWLSILFACLGAVLAATVIGLINGVGVAVFGVSPFIMTLGIQSVGAGVALYLTGGVPISNLPDSFGNIFGFGEILDIPVPIFIAVLAIILTVVLLYRMRLGRYLYAVGGNIKAANLSGIGTKRVVILAYIMSAAFASIAGILLTARVQSGDSNLGGSITLESIAACVIGGVSLHGGIARVENVVLGAFFIVLVENGMDLMQVGSFMQMILVGGLLILAVIVDQFRYRLIVGGNG
jgi:ribose transport system permease protein